MTFALTFFLVLIVLLQVGARYIWNYKLGQQGIDFVLFGLFVIKRIRYEDIEEASEVPWSRTWFFGADTIRTHGLGNRFFGRVVSIRQQNWILHRFVLITPDGIDGFLRELATRCPEAIRADITSMGSFETDRGSADEQFGTGRPEHGGCTDTAREPSD
jgi:hypothetical protein